MVISQQDANCIWRNLEKSKVCVAERPPLSYECIINYMFCFYQR